MVRCRGVWALEEYEALLAKAKPVPQRADDLRCVECGAKLELRHSRHGLFYGCTTWRTTRCRGAIRANPDGSPEGVAVDDRTREARLEASTVFDELWKTGKMSVEQARLWLGEELGLRPGYMHFGILSVEQCARVVACVDGMLTEDEQLQIAERALMGEGPDSLAAEEQALLAQVPRDRDVLARKLRGGYLQSADLCRLLGISLGSSSQTTIRNILEALRVYDHKRRRSGAGRANSSPLFELAKKLW